MSISTPISTGTDGQPITGTSGSALTNSSVTALNGNDFLDLMLAQLQNQDPTNPSSTDPTEFMSELAEMTSVEQETNTAQSTAQSASEQAISAAVGLIGDTVSYTDPSSGKSITGQVASVQITSAGPTITVGSQTGISPGSVTTVSQSTSATPSTTTGGTAVSS